MATPTTNPSQDPTNSLHLHHSDGPSLVLTSQPLDHKNYTTWSIAMKVSFSVKNKTVFIDDTLPKPKEKAVDEGVEVLYPVVPSKKEKDRHMARFLDIFRKLEITMPFGEALQ